jgi:hypothetical protein
MKQGGKPATHRLAEYDVTHEVDTTSVVDVSFHVGRLYEEAYRQPLPSAMVRVFADVERLYRGEFAGYHRCETWYHDLQHVLDVTLAMARLMSGCLKSAGAQSISEPRFQLGLVSALLHDVGYLRRLGDREKQHGAEYTRIHVSRSAEFMNWYLPAAGLSGMAAAASRIVHFTGYEIPVQRIEVDPQSRLIGNLLGSADILAQMSDRCYLEKCRDRLYPEFVLGGIAREGGGLSGETIVFESAEDLLLKTPLFFTAALQRLEQDLAGAYQHLEACFGGVNLYMHETRKNIEHARRLGQSRDWSRLRRRMPDPVPALPRAA